MIYYKPFFVIFVMMQSTMEVNGKVGIGFRREFASDFINSDVLKPGFVEFSPENWIGMGGFWKKKLDVIVENYPVVCHSLAMSIGSPDDLDMNYLRDIKQFLSDVNCQMYSFHLSFAKCDNAHLYELLPIPFTEDAIKHVANKIRIVQDFLERPIAIENSSYYTPLAPEMEEIEFVNSVMQEANCKMLLDVNNVYVNAFNHKYDAEKYISELDLERVMYIHMAGHTQVSEDTIIDTHGEPIIDPVYDLFEFAIKKLPPVPILLERDFNIPKLAELQQEVSALQTIVNKVWSLEKK